MHEPRRLLVVDLNNFARYPTLPVGYLAAVARNAGYEVRVFSPLMVGVKGVPREERPKPWSLLAAKLNHRAATSRREWLRRLRDRLAASRRSGIRAHHKRVQTAIEAEIRSVEPHIVLISTYLMYRDTCEATCRAALQLGIPVIVGGPYFAQPEVIEAWVSLPGLSLLVAGEIELELPDILDKLLTGACTSDHAGLFVAGDDGRAQGRIAPPLQNLDVVPFPDYSDFPWSAYPNRIVPIVTGRGCGWGACTFCSDVTSSAGRTFRSRSVENVLMEVTIQHRTHAVNHFVFTDLKLNSEVGMWRGIIEGIQAAAPGCSWIAAVHVGPESDNGLDTATLRDAAKAGCVRLTTGLETGSQRVADAMKKGTRIDRVSRFLHDASGAGISTRCTMVLGHPGETAEDVASSVDFLVRHRIPIERVSLNRLQVITGTLLHRTLQKKQNGHSGFGILHEDAGMAQVAHEDSVMHTAAHRRQVARLLTAVHRINRKPILARARAFEGVM